jgi:hypothetical protein
MRIQKPRRKNSAAPLVWDLGLSTNRFERHIVLDQGYRVHLGALRPRMYGTHLRTSPASGWPDSDEGLERFY